MTKILVIDDSALIRSKIKQMLSTYDQSKIETHIEPTFGLEYVQKHKPDVVILDIELKGINGLLLLKQIKEFDPKIKVIVFTNLVMTAYKNMSMKLNADHFFDKTTEIPEFLGLFRKNTFISNNLVSAISATNAQ
jgi:two-component system, NarL family, invasion response regulator UvrY